MYDILISHGYSPDEAIYYLENHTKSKGVNLEDLFNVDMEGSDE